MVRFGNLFSVLDPDDFYLCDLLRVRSSGFENLDFLVNVRRVHPLCAAGLLRRPREAAQQSPQRTEGEKK